MKACPYCGYSNHDNAVECRSCQASFLEQGGTLYKGRTYWVGPQKARDIRRKALSFVVLALLMKVYWGGYGPWPVVDLPILVSLRAWLEPLFLYGGATAYVAGWVLNWI
jgi:hypothetical protein